MSPEKFEQRVIEAQSQPSREDDVQRSHWRSWGFWAFWMVAGLVWELWCLREERKTGDEPLTRLFRDRLFHLKMIGPLIGAGTAFFLAWLLVHWFAPGVLHDGPPTGWTP